MKKKTSGIKVYTAMCDSAVLQSYVCNPLSIGILIVSRLPQINLEPNVP